MELCKGDMFASCGESSVHHNQRELHNHTVLLVTANSSIRSDGTLVMGRGAARQTTVYFQHQNLPMNFGKVIKNESQYGIRILPSSTCRNNFIGVFQVKKNWMDDAQPSLIHDSMLDLWRLCAMMPSHRFSLNFPGIGNGRLPRDRVEKMLKDMFDVEYLEDIPIPNLTLYYM